MLKVSCLLLSLFILLDGYDCDPQKQNERISALETDVKQLKTEVVALEQKGAAPQHHYELRNEGLRTFRFDSATGATCIQLSSAADWKKKDTQQQSCACVDATQRWIEMPTTTVPQQKYADYYHQRVKEVCGD